MTIRWSGDNGNTDNGPDSAVLILNGNGVAEFKGTVLLDGAETLEPYIIHHSLATDTLEMDCFYYEAFSNRAK